MSNKYAENAEKLVGQRFGNLTVLYISSERAKGSRQFICVCSCECGKSDIRVLKSSLLNGHTKSCGCLSNLNREFLQRKYIASRSELVTLKKICVICNREFEICYNNSIPTNRNTAEKRKKCDLCKLKKSLCRSSRDDW